MWDRVVPDQERDDIVDIGCSDAVAREAAPSSATSGHTDIVQRMPPGAVNLEQVASAMGRGPILNDDGESGRRLEDAQEARRGNRTDDAQGNQDKTSDDHG